MMDAKQMKFCGALARALQIGVKFGIFGEGRTGEMDIFLLIRKEETPSVRALATAPQLRDVSTAIQCVELSFGAAFGRF